MGFTWDVSSLYWLVLHWGKLLVSDDRMVPCLPFPASDIISPFAAMAGTSEHLSVVESESPPSGRSTILGRNRI